MAIKQFVKTGKIKPKSVGPNDPKGGSKPSKQSKFRDERIQATLKTTQQMVKQGTKLQPRYVKRVAKAYRSLGADPNYVERQMTIRALGGQAVSETLAPAGAKQLMDSKLINNITGGETVQGAVNVNEIKADRDDENDDDTRILYRR